MFKLTRSSLFRLTCLSCSPPKLPHHVSDAIRTKHIAHYYVVGWSMRVCEQPDQRHKHKPFGTAEGSSMQRVTVVWLWHLFF